MLCFSYYSLGDGEGCAYLLKLEKKICYLRKGTKCALFKKMLSASQEA